LLRIAICDDDSMFVSQTKDLLEQWPGRPGDLRIHTFTSGDTLVQAHARLSFDVILLDMVMPLLDGMETAREIRLTDPIVKIIFLTSSPEFALESYSVKASNYLLKPVDPDALYQSFDELLLEYQKVEKYILIHSASGTYRVRLDEIECVEAQRKHTLLMLIKGKTIHCTDPLNVLESELLKEEHFLQCHRSYIININSIRFMSPSDIETDSGYRVPISRSNRNEFTKLYFDRMFKKEEERYT